MALGPKGVNLDHDVIILFIMSQSFTVMILTIVRPTLRDENVETPFCSVTVKLINPLGAILGWTILLLQHDRVLVGPYLYGVLFMSLVLYAFSILMLIRPINTDMGLMYSMYALSIDISVKDHKVGYQTRMTFGLCVLLVFVTAFFEYRVVIAAAAEVARVNGNVEVVVVADRVEAMEGVDDAIEKADRMDGEVAADRVEAVKGEVSCVDGEVAAVTP
ncbi:hypothetical protein KY290_037906 [Solanum tuberosum]|uniref:Uncharacterized protein n=1 Tax=Solanum tuberosum TaxID=4113 RepID=A0ABQ7TYI9_SOLTU|nr:hypothetical protein KY290_037906 [Solanum tuberosum]